MPTPKQHVKRDTQGHIIPNFLVCIYGGCYVTGDLKDLEDHSVAIHGVTRPVYHCIKEDCKRTFPSLQKRRAHLKRQHGFGI